MKSHGRDENWVTLLFWEGMALGDYGCLPFTWKDRLVDGYSKWDAYSRIHLHIKTICNFSIQHSHHFVELNFSGPHKAYFTQITHRIVAKDHQHTRKTKEEPYQAPKAHTLCTATFVKPSFISLVVSRSKTIQAKRPGTSKNKQMEHTFSFGNSVWEFWATFQEILFSRGNFCSGRRKWSFHLHSI